MSDSPSTKQVQVLYKGVPFSIGVASNLKDDEARAKIESYLSSDEGQQLYAQKLDQQERDSQAALVEDKLTKDVERFAPRKALEAGGYLAARVNKGLVGNLIDLPFQLGNMAISVANKKEGINLPFANLPSQNLLGLDTGAVFDPERASQDEELKERLRPLGIGLETAASFALPQALIGKVAGRMTAPTITAKTSVAPTALAQADLPLGSIVTPGTVTQQMTTKGAQIANNIAAGASGIGAGVASEAFRGSEYQPIAEVVGSIVAPVAGVMAAKSATAMGNRIFNEKLTERGADIETAMQVFAQNADNPTLAVQNYKKNVRAGRTGNLADLTEDAGIASVVNSIASKSGVAKDKILRLDQQKTDEFIDTLDSLGDDQASLFFKTYVDKKNAALEESLTKRIKSAERTAQTDQERALRGLVEPSVASKKIYEEIQVADDLSKKYLDDLWDKVPNPFVNRKNVKAFSRRALSKESIQSDQAREAVGTVFDKYIKSLGATAEAGRVPVKELIDFRSNILREIRILQGKRESSSEIERFGQQLQNDAMDLISKAPGKGQAYKRAANETRTVKDVFDRATFGLRDDPALVGSKLFAGKERGVVKADELAKMAGFNEGIPEAMISYIRGAFKDVAVKSVDGTDIVDPSNASEFLSKHREVLSRPEYRALRDEFEQAASSQKMSEEMLSLRTSSLAEREKQAFNTWSKYESPDEAVNAFLRSKNPRQDAESLYLEAAQDPSGNALAGLKRNFVDSILDSVFDDDVLRGAATTKKSYKKIKPAMDVIFKDDPESIKIMDDVFDQIFKSQKLKRANRSPFELSNSAIVDAVVNIAGTRLGVKSGKITGQPGLQAATLGKKVLDKLIKQMPAERVNNMIEEIIVNPEKFSSQIGLISKASDELEVVAAAKGFIDSFSPEALATMPVSSIVQGVRFGTRLVGAEGLTPIGVPTTVQSRIQEFEEEQE